MSDTCLTRDMLKRWLERGMNETEAESTLSHIRQCPTCRAMADNIMSRFGVGMPFTPRMNPSDVKPTDAEAIQETSVVKPDAVQADLNATVDAQVPIQNNPTRSNFAGHVSPLLTKPDQVECIQIGGRIESYKLDRVLGEGGFGIVYLAQQDVPFHKIVALKILRPGTDDREIVRRFDVERQLLARLEHRHIAQIYGGGVTATGSPYFVMEYVDGAPITEYCDTHRLTITERLRLFVDVCHAVHYAHQKGVIHRDLKPSNILVRYHDGIHDAKVIDFGIAKAIGHDSPSDTTMKGQLVGTWRYMSPEQLGLTSFGVDTRSDVYSLGTLLYELLIGTTPFELGSLSAVKFWEALVQVREIDAPQPSLRLELSAKEIDQIAELRSTKPVELIKSIKGELDWIVLRAVEKDLDGRYESAKALAADIGRFLNHEVVEAGPASARYRLRKYFRRNRTTITFAAVIALVMILGTTVSIIYAFRAEVARDRAVLAEHAQREQTERALDLLYAAQLRLASQQRDAGDDEQAERLISQWVPNKGEEDRRGIEWRLLNQSLKVPQQLLMTLPGDLSAVRYSPDRTYLVAGENGGSIHRYDVQANKELVAWDTDLRDVRRLEFSPDGSTLAAISYRGDAVLLDTATGDIRHRFPRYEHATGTADVEYFDNQTVLTMKAGNLVRVWNTDDGRHREDLDFGDFIVADCATRPGSQFAVLLKRDQGRYDEVRIYDKPGGSIVFSSSLNSTQSANALCLSSSGRYLAIGFSNGKLDIWDLSARDYASLNVTEEIIQLEFSDDEQALALAERSGVVHVLKWKFDHEKSDKLSLNVAEHVHWHAHERPARFVIFAADAGQVISTGQDGRVVKWNWNQNRTLTIPSRHISEMAWLEHRNAFAFLSQDSVTVVDPSTGNLLENFALFEHGGRNLAVATEGRHLCWNVHGGSCYIWNAKAGEKPFPLPESENPQVDPIPHFLSGGDEVITTIYGDRFIKIWNVQTRALTRKLELAQPVGYGFIASQQRKGLYYVTDDTLNFVNFEDGAAEQSYAFDGRSACSYALSRDGSRLAIGRTDRIIHLVNTADGRIERTLIGHLGEIRRLQFTPDGKTLLALDIRGTLKFWRVPQGVDAMTWPSSQPIAGYCLSPDANTLALSFANRIELLKIQPISEPEKEQVSLLPRD